MNLNNKVETTQDATPKNTSLNDSDSGVGSQNSSAIGTSSQEFADELHGDLKTSQDFGDEFDGEFKNASSSGELHFLKILYNMQMLCYSLQVYFKI